MPEKLTTYPYVYSCIIVCLLMKHTAASFVCECRLLGCSYLSVHFLVNLPLTTLVQGNNNGRDKITHSCGAHACDVCDAHAYDVCDAHAYDVCDVHAYVFYAAHAYKAIYDNVRSSSQ